MYLVSINLSKNNQFKSSLNSTRHRTQLVIVAHNCHTAVSQALACQCKSLRELPKPGKRRSFPKICLFCRVDLLQQTNSSWYCRQMGRSGCSIFTITHPWDNLVDFQTSMKFVVNNFAWEWFYLLSIYWKNKILTYRYQK